MVRYFSLKSLKVLFFIALIISFVKVSLVIYLTFAEGLADKTALPMACIRWVFPRPELP